MLKIKGQRWRSQRKVVYQQQKRYNTAMYSATWNLLSCYGVVIIKAGEDWRGLGGLKLQCIRNCHVF